jgi:phosphoribosylformylglycinamidine synthase
MLQAHIRVTPKPGINDPQGLAVRGGLHQLGFAAVESVRVGKYLVLTLDTDDEAAAQRQVTAMCERLLANPLIEDYTLELTRLAPAPQDGG